MLDYKLLEAMAMVVTEGGFDKAAKKLFITQSAVSQRIKQLEDLLGQLLLTRTTPVKATDAGMRLMKHYQQVSLLEKELDGHFAVGESGGFTTIPISINADSIATWFVGAVLPSLSHGKILLDVIAEDQEQTHQLLKNGDVLGCVSSQKDAFQGCSVQRLGTTVYRLVASPSFLEKWCGGQVQFDDLSRIPALLFNRKDDLHNKFYETVFDKRPVSIPSHYLPSTEKFVDYICSGIAYGVLMDQQCADLIETGELVELFPSATVTVDLYWHRWSFSSAVLDDFSASLVRTAKQLLFSSRS